MTCPSFVLIRTVIDGLVEERIRHRCQLVDRLVVAVLVRSPVEVVVGLARNLVEVLAVEAVEVLDHSLVEALAVDRNLAVELVVDHSQVVEVDRNLVAVDHTVVQVDRIEVVQSLLVEDYLTQHS